MLLESQAVGIKIPKKHLISPYEYLEAHLATMIATLHVGLWALAQPKGPTIARERTSNAAQKQLNYAAEICSTLLSACSSEDVGKMHCGRRKVGTIYKHSALRLGPVSLFTAFAAWPTRCCFHTAFFVSQDTTARMLSAFMNFIATPVITVIMWHSRLADPFTKLALVTCQSIN